MVTYGNVSAQAFLAASLKTDAELLKWFRDRLVWNEPETVVDLLKQGLFVRLYEPQVWGNRLMLALPHSTSRWQLALSSFSFTMCLSGHISAPLANPIAKMLRFIVQLALYCICQMLFIP